jgi:hypothetical protein
MREFYAISVRLMRATVRLLVVRFDMAFGVAILRRSEFGRAFA